MKKVLVVVDMQNDFITGCLGNAECAAVVKNVTEVLATKEYDHVFVTKDTHQSNYMNTQEGKKLPVIHCVEGTEGWELNKEVLNTINACYDSTKVTEVCKPSFGSIELSGLLKQYVEDAKEEVEFYFTGVCTGICVISNVIITKAALPENKVCVIEKACACVTPDTHKTAIEAMKTCQVDIL